MYKKVCLLTALMVLFSAPIRAELFDNNDILGEWSIYNIEVNPVLGAYWYFADINVTSTTDITGVINTPDGTIMNIINGEASLTTDGSLSGSFSTDAGLTGTVVDGLQDQNHSIFSYVGVDSQDSLSLAVGIKKGDQYQLSNMAGDWRFYAIEIDPVVAGIYWIMGDATVDTNGNITNGDYLAPDGTAIKMTSGNIALSSEGKISGTFNFDDGSITQVSDGMADMLKTFAVFVDTNSTGRIGFDIALQKGGDYLPSDLAGDWVFYNFTVDTANELAYWLHGDGTIDRNGDIKGIYTGPDGTVSTISSGNASLSDSGEITGSFTVDSVATETIQSGFMDQNKSIIVFVGTSDNDQMDLGIGYRTSALPRTEPPPAGRDGGSGGCFIQALTYR